MFSDAGVYMAACPPLIEDVALREGGFDREHYYILKSCKKSVEEARDAGKCSTMMQAGRDVAYLCFARGKK